MITLNEMERRYLTLKEAMKEHNLDALIIYGTAETSGRGNLRYLTNWRIPSRRAYLFVPLNNEPVLICTTKGHMQTAMKVGFIKDVRWIECLYELHPFKPAEILGHLLANFPGSKPHIGIAGTPRTLGLTAPEFETIRQLAPKATFSHTDTVLRNIRAVKNDVEMKFVEEASALADLAYDVSLRNLKKGKQEIEIFAEIYRELIIRGLEDSLFLVDSESKNSFIHHPTKRMIEKGDLFILSVEVSSAPYGYWSQIARPISIGPPQSWAERLFDVALTAESVGKEYLKEGNRVSDVAIKMLNAITKAGCQAGHWVGHGMGLDLGEYPPVSSECDDILKEGMIITLHPYIYDLDGHGMFYGNTFVVGKTGCTELTHAPKELLTII